MGVTPHQGERESRLQGQVAQVSTINQKGGVCVMQIAEALLEIIHERGKRGLPLERCPVGVLKETNGTPKSRWHMQR